MKCPLARLPVVLLARRRMGLYFEQDHLPASRRDRHVLGEGALKGIPVTLEVPTHLKLTFVRQQYWVPKEGDAGRFLQNDKDALVTFDLKHDFIKEKKIFLVDFKRPAAGTMEFGAAIDKDTSGFTNVSYKVNDLTIETIGKQVNDLVKNILPALGKRTTVVASDTAATKLVTIDSIVATTIVKLDDPAFQEKVREFLCCASQAAGLPPCACPGVACGVLPLVRRPTAGASSRPGISRRAGQLPRDHNLPRARRRHSTQRFDRSNAERHAEEQPCRPRDRIRHRRRSGGCRQRS